MRQDNRKQLISLLIDDIENYIGRKLKSPKDFQRLAETLPMESPLSISTLKRLWHYVPNEHAPRESTLDILTRLIGYEDWQNYCNMHPNVSESDFLTAINTQRDIADLAILKLTWLPDRQCTLRKTKNGKFCVIAATNTKLQVGDEFYTAWLEKGKPLLATQFMRNGKLCPDYIAGKKNGLTSITIYNHNE